MSSGVRGKKMFIGIESSGSSGDIDKRTEELMVNKTIGEHFKFVYNKNKSVALLCKLCLKKKRKSVMIDQRMPSLRRHLLNTHCVKIESPTPEKKPTSASINESKTSDTSRPGEEVHDENSPSAVKPGTAFTKETVPAAKRNVLLVPEVEETEPVILARDEHSVYGENVANRLRKIHDDYLLSIARNRIDQVLFEIEMVKYQHVRPSSSVFAPDSTLEITYTPAPIVQKEET